MTRVFTLFLLLFAMFLTCGAFVMLLQPEPVGARPASLPAAFTRSWATIKLMFR